MTRKTVLFVVLALVLVGACTKRRNPPTAPSPPGPVRTGVIHMVGTTFVPKDTTVAFGDTVLWLNSSNLPHTSTSGACPSSCNPDGLWDSGVISPGDSFRVVFAAGTDVPGIVHIDSTGAFPYFCSIHPGMIGSLTVNP